MNASLRAMFGTTDGKRDLFNLWLQRAKDFGQVKVAVSRRNVERHESHCNTVTWSRAQLEQSNRYTPEDINDLIKRCVARGAYMDDPNFPGVERLRRYTFVDEVGKQSSKAQEDVQEVKNAGEISHQEAMDLTSAGQVHTSNMFVFLDM